VTQRVPRGGRARGRVRDAAGVHDAEHGQCGYPARSAWVTFHRAYRHATQQAFLEAHELAFAYFDGVFRRLRYDNLGAAVKRVLRGSRREETSRFVAFRPHWRLAAECRPPGEGHELLCPALRQDRTRGVLRDRIHIQQTRPVFAEYAFRIVRADSVDVARNLDVGHAARIKDAESTGIGRTFRRYDAARLEHNGRDEIGRLLRSRTNDDVFRPGRASARAQRRSTASRGAFCTSHLQSICQRSRLCRSGGPTSLLLRHECCQRIEVRVKKYSKGKTKRIGLADELINTPNVLLLDEQKDGVDPVGYLADGLCVCW